MGALRDDIDRLMREPVQRSALGMAGWVEGSTEGIKRLQDQLDPEARAIAEREAILGMLRGQRDAIRRQADELEQREAPDR